MLKFIRIVGYVSMFMLVSFILFAFGTEQKAKKALANANVVADGGAQKIG